MSQPSPPPNSPPLTTAPAARPWQHSWRWLVSLALMWHLMGVLAPPLRAVTYGTGIPSPFTSELLRYFRPYAEIMFLDHGYQFFAPEPGPLHLIRFKVEFDDGRPAIEETFPNLQTERPRLLYHRYFMLAESLQALYISPTEPPRPVPPAADNPNRRLIVIQQDIDYTRELSEWQMRRSKYEQLRLSIIAHLEKEYPGGKATITRVRHLLPNPPDATSPVPQLNEPSTYIDLSEDDGLPAGQPQPIEVLP